LDYWTNHKPIYFAYKLPNYVPQYHHISKKKLVLQKSSTTMTKPNSGEMLKI
jgi:hypothetical protein